MLFELQQVRLIKICSHELCSKALSPNLSLMHFLFRLTGGKIDALSLLPFSFFRSFQLSVGYIRNFQENDGGLKFYRTHQLLISAVRLF
jgi:hypothetical protein